jgi:hypothetical protein
MLAPDEVAAMLGLRGLGWGAKRIAAEFGWSRNTEGPLSFGGQAGCDGLSSELGARRPAAAR